MSKLALVREEDVLKYMTRDMAYQAIATAFLEIAKQTSHLFPVTIGRGADEDSMVAIKSGFLASDQVVGLKVGTYWPNNHQYQVPNHGSTTLLLDPKTGFPMALINATKLNGMRTAAANAIATNLLANPQARTLLVVGPGHQSHYELLALCDVRNFARVLIWGRDPRRSTAFIESLSEYRELCEVAVDLQQAVKEADVIVTATTATEPLFDAEWVQPGTHISAMGADKKGKQELPTELLDSSRLFADYPKQSIEIGEFQHHTTWQNPIVAIGEAIASPEVYRYQNDKITIFDSSGIALQDISSAYQIFSQMRKAGTVTWIDF